MTNQLSLAERLAALDLLTATARTPGNADHDPYMLGMANGLTLAHATMNNETPPFLSPPNKWVGDRGAQMLDWALNNFGALAGDTTERATRFIEEAVELVHALGLPIDTLERVAVRAYTRPLGNVKVEAAQTQLTLEALAANIGVNLDREAMAEFDRIKAIPKEHWQARQNAKARDGIATPISEAAE